MSDRIVLHCDCNSFFASVETVFRPELKKVPMAVAGDAEARHGIILAKNELAKKYGIETAETIYSAKRKCPDLVLVPPHHREYGVFSAKVRRIYERYTDQIEPFGMDEAWLDVTASRALFGDGVSIAHKIRETVKREVGITVSVGVSFNKVFAKMGSDYKKPDAVTVIDRSNYKTILYPMPVGTLLFVGKQTAQALNACNIRTIGELAAASPSFLASRFGKMGEMLSVYARGEDESPVANIYETSDVKSVSNGMTFRHDITTRDEMRLGIASLSEDVAYRLRKKGMKCTTVAITVKDTALKSFTRQAPVPLPTNLSSEIADAAYALAEASVPAGKAVRMLTVAALQLIRENEAVEQIDFFGAAEDEKRTRRGMLENTVDEIRSRFGHASLKKGAVIGNDLGIGDGERKEGRTDEKNHKNSL